MSPGFVSCAHAKSIPWLTPFVIMRLSGLTTPLASFSLGSVGSDWNAYWSVRNLAMASRVSGEPHLAT